MTVNMVRLLKQKKYPISRQTIKPKTNHNMKFMCFFLARRTKKDKTLKWYRDGTLLLNSELAKNESYRIKISARGHLKFAEIKPKDAGSYKCSYSKDKEKKEWIIKGKMTNTSTQIIKMNVIFFSKTSLQ